MAVLRFLDLKLTQRQRLPSWMAGGRRYYEQEQLLRLQRILLLRELCPGLDTIVPGCWPSVTGSIGLSRPWSPP